MASEPYDPANLLDVRTPPARMEHHYRHQEAREAAIVVPRLPRGGRVLSVGAGLLPGRHLFQAPDWHLTAVDADPGRAGAAEGADVSLEGRAGELAGLFAPGSFDAVLHRHVLHHIAFQGPLGPVFAEAARLLAPGGALVVIEPSLWHPVGAALQLANRAGAAERIHGTRDDIPLSPRRLLREARVAGLVPELHAVTYGWRRLPVRAQEAVHRLDRLGSVPGLRGLGHTVVVIGRKGATA